MRRKHAIALGAAGALLVAGGLGIGIPAVKASATVTCTLSNPITPGADPSVWYRNGLYYLVQSDGARSINIRSSSTINGLGTATPRTIWTSPTGTDHSAETWAPELEYLNGQWIIYFAAATDEGGDPATNNTHRIFAITANTQDPSGSWSFFGKITDSTNQWSIDPTVFFYNSNWYMLWSGTPTGNGGNPPQQIYIAHMSDPLHIDQDYRRLIANPDQTWETSVQAIEEGPEAWIGPNNTLTIVYNANASWTTSYALGELVYKGGDLTTYQSYTKRGPVFSSGGGVYGPGGESIPVPGAAGVNWNIYHAKTSTANGWNDREIFAQPVPWNTDGTPNFGTPTGSAGYNEGSEQRCG
ncbi:family 43 glycosylhydrolase [Curtobacterium ammoniigenes]|uniref:family 43 glycosylhydrolase n=1 Tax=Curtobacterium ammoniigenes TaxID=395387 RepID=UPI00146FFAD8|nr:family 43 glycosylhydrolase [Curtobacterium ammoniigenes]